MIRMYRLALLTILLSLLADHASAAERPNVLFLFADDQRADTVAAFGNDVIQTPHLDSIVERGFRFTNAYCMGAMQGAVCVPSRAMVNSGLHLFDVKDNKQLKGVPTLGEMLQENGYVTFGTGKWHNGEEAAVRSFTTGEAVFLGGMNDHTKVPIVDIEGGEAINQRVGEKFSNTLFADAAVKFLESLNGDKPFYAYVAFTAPHDPRQFPEETAELYPPEQMPLPENYLPQHPFFNGWMTGRDEALAPWPRTKTIVRHQLADYYRLITHMDRQIGRILTALEESGEADNTIIVYSADHGLAMGSHGLLGKQSVYEHAMKAPLVLSGPDIPVGESDAFAYLYDIPTTILSLTGTTPKGEVAGKDLSVICRGEKESVRDEMFLAYEKYMRSIRTREWKLIRYTHINKTQLFNLDEDPHELNDLSNDHRQATRIGWLFARMKRVRKAYGDDQPLTSDDPQDGEIDLTDRKRKADRHQPEWIVKKYFDLEGWNWKDE